MTRADPIIRAALPAIALLAAGAAATALQSAAPVGDLRRPAAPPDLQVSGAPGQASNAVAGTAVLDDSIPFPTPAVRRPTAQGDVEERPATGDPFFLDFAAGPFYPLPAETVAPRLYASALPDYADGRPSAETYAFVMFSKRMTSARLDRLGALGCRTLGFHPHYTHKVALPAAAVDQVAALDFVRWVGVPEPWQKVHPALSAQLAGAAPNQPVEVWVNVFETDIGASSVRQVVTGGTEQLPGGDTRATGPLALTGVWTTNGWQQAALEGAGLDVRHFAERVNAFRARMLPQGLDLVTGLDFVQFVELVSPSATKHDETAAMIGLDGLRDSYPGSFSQRSIVGVVDGGMEILHPDLTRYGFGWDLSGSSGGAWEDLCGHGTHVAGTVFGSGTLEAGHTGMAPGLGTWPDSHIYNVRVFEDCTPQVVSVAAVLGVTGAGFGVTPRPHLINNSWGTDPTGSAWYGTETDPRLYDDNAYSSAQLNVFAAGNAGPAAGSIGLQASAKNVLTVGSVVDFDEPLAGGEPGLLAFDSARGPLADGRWKPNVVAPGELVTSADAFDLGGYATKFGTSMAAAHVTGLAADLLDANSFFEYLPERMTSHLMATALTKDGVRLTLSTDPHLDTYGTGRVEAQRAAGFVLPEGTWYNWGFAADPTDFWFGDFTVPSGAQRIVAVMHYVEQSASAGAGTALINDWDFYIDQPPLDPASNTGEWFAHQSAVDNTETRILDYPVTGTWRWKLHPESTVNLAYFGVTVYVQWGSITPTISQSLLPESTAVQPLQPIQIIDTVSAVGGRLSGVFLESSTSGGASYLSASTFLLDGIETSLLDNTSGGTKLMLGNVNETQPRYAGWLLQWPAEGSQTFSVTAHSENASNDLDLVSTTITVDGTAPGTATDLASPSHGSGWSNDPTVDLTWTPATDPVSGGTSSGTSGYADSVTAGGPATPAAVQTLGNVAATATSPLGEGQHWFNLRAVDTAGNWGGTASLGPLSIDLTPPGALSGLVSTTHQVGISYCDDVVTMTWDPAADGLSGVAGYAASWDQDPTGLAPAGVNAPGTSFTATLASSGQPWYFHVRAVDNAGNGGSQLDAGPYTIQTNPTTIYCNAKLNSQGCLPKIGSIGAPSLSGGTFTVTAEQVLNNKNGLLFWGTASLSAPFQGGTKCVANPVKRTPIQGSGGNPPPDDCSGNYAFAFDTAYMNAKGLTPGDTAYAQWWSRDPAAPFSTGLTDALKFQICP